MYFPEKFYRLPLDFDHEKLLEEISAVDESHWSPHPQAFKGNDALILLSNGGTINDLNYGAMEFTPCMAQLPYLKQVLQSFNTVIGRTRLMRLAPGEKVGRHSDVSLYWWHRFRIHVPIVTDPEVKFYCEDTHVHMQAGEAWTFDNWRYHEVHNNSNITRVHLVIDTVGSPEIWKMLENESWNPEPGETLTPKNFPTTFISFDKDKEATFQREQHNIIGVLSPAELDAIADFLINDLDHSHLNSEQTKTIEAHLQYLKRSWRAFFSVYGRDESYYQDYAHMLANVVKSLNDIEPKPTLKSNGFLLANVLKTQVSLTIQDVINKQIKEGLTKTFDKPAQILSPARLNLSTEPAQNISPIFIVSAPRGGGAFIESRLNNSLSIKTIDPEIKQEINELFKLHYTPEETDDVTEVPKETLQNIFIEKVLKQQTDQTEFRYIYFDNYLALRIPSLLRSFPQAQFIYVFREPQKNIAGLVNDWETEEFKNNFATEKTGGNWHHPLPKHWQENNLNDFENKLSFQYREINHYIMDSLSQLPKESVFCLDFQTLIEQSHDTTEALCAFCQIPFGPKMQAAARQKVKDIDLGALDIAKLQKDSLLIQTYEQIQEWAKARKY